MIRLSVTQVVALTLVMTGMLIGSVGCSKPGGSEAEKSQYQAPQESMARTYQSGSNPGRAAQRPDGQ